MYKLKLEKLVAVGFLALMVNSGSVFSSESTSNRSPIPVPARIGDKAAALTALQGRISTDSNAQAFYDKAKATVGLPAFKEVIQEYNATLVANTATDETSKKLNAEHEKKIKEAEEKLNQSEQKVQQVTQEKQEVEQKKNEAEKKAAEAAERAKIAEKKADEVAGEFAHKIGTVVLELSSIRYLAYQSPDLYRKTLEAIISASQGINNLIIDYTKDVGKAKLIQYVRLPIVPPTELTLREKNLLALFSVVHKYLINIFQEINAQLLPFRNKLTESKIDEFRDKCTEMETLMGSLRNVSDIVKFLQNTQMMKDLASSIESILGNATQAIGNLYAERTGKKEEEAYKVSSHLYDLHDFIISESQTKKFQKREDYFTGLTEPRLTPIGKPPGITKIIELDKSREEYVNAQIGSVLTTLFGHSNTVTLAQLNQQVTRGNSAEKAINQFQITAASAYSVAYKKVVAEDHKSFVPKIYSAMWDKFKGVNKKDITTETTKLSTKLEGAGKQLIEYLKNLEETKKKIIFDFSNSTPADIVNYLNKFNGGLLDFIKDQPAYAQRIKDLSQLIDNMPPGNTYIKDLTKRIEDALAKHVNLQEALMQLQSMPNNITKDLINGELAIPEALPNLHTIKGHIKDIVLKQDYLAIKPKKRAESFSYALGALGLDVPGVWIRPVSPEIHKAFLRAYEAYKEARDAIVDITNESIDDGKAFMTISDFTGAVIAPVVIHGGPPPGVHGAPPPPGARGGPPPPPGVRGGPPPPPGALGGPPGGLGRAVVNLLTKKPTDTVTISGKPYQIAQVKAIGDLIGRIDDKITILLKDKNQTLKNAGKSEIDPKKRKPIAAALYQFLWNEFYMEVQNSYTYIDVELMSCQEAIDYIDHKVLDVAFDNQFERILTSLGL